MTQNTRTILTILLTALIVAGGILAYDAYEDKEMENDTNSEEVIDNDDMDEDEMEDEDMVSTDGTYTNSEYGYSLKLASDYSVDRDFNDGPSSENTIKNSVWFGPDSDFWSDGFYVRVVEEDLSTAYKNTLSAIQEVCIDQPYPSTDCDKLTYTEKTQNINGVSANVITYDDAIGYDIVKYYIQANNNVFEIQGVESSNATQSIIKTLQFEEENNDSATDNESDDDSSQTADFNAEEVFEALTFENKIYKYKIDHPKNWYWQHYGKTGGIMDLAAFDSNATPETANEYVGKIAVQILRDQTNADAKANLNGLSNVSSSTITNSNGVTMTYATGEMPSDGLNMGDTNKMYYAYFEDGSNLYMIVGTGLTDEDAKIFMQMVDSFEL